MTHKSHPDLTYLMHSLLQETGAFSGVWSLKRSNSFAGKVSLRRKMHAQQKSQSNACFQLHMNFCRLYKQKKEKWRNSFKKSNRECKTSPGINYICGICQDLGNYVHLGNWIHQLPPLFAIRYRKYACYVRRDHSLALKCLKMKETSSFCPHVFKCIWYMLYRKEQ